MVGLGIFVLLHDLIRFAYDLLDHAPQPIVHSANVWPNLEWLHTQSRWAVKTNLEINTLMLSEACFPPSPPRPHSILSLSSENKFCCVIESSLLSGLSWWLHKCWRVRICQTSNYSTISVMFVNRDQMNPLVSLVFWAIIDLFMISFLMYSIFHEASRIWYRLSPWFIKCFMGFFFLVFLITMVRPLFSWVKKKRLLLSS